eukprot:TRINITY_DN116254_c0_g1_i1.p1 TRINITY_DN116254_c0_g1~~TRINITY_DN116254_c0_g1_i1.p1  ORF type:complete len:227 (-),score=27.18 TRINITY_DN116254_c0_g1_i1:50-730(-)
MMNFLKSRPKRRCLTGCLALLLASFATHTLCFVGTRPGQHVPPAVTRAAEESTLQKITGPKLFKSVTKIEGIHSVPLLPLRVGSGILMIHHGSEGGFWPANYGTPGFQGFVDFIVKPYFSFLPGSPELWSAIHDYAEFGGGILLVLGLFTRPASFVLFVTMCAAVYFHLASTGWQGFPFGHVENYSYNFEEPALYAFIFLLFFFNGAGPVSLDSIIYSQVGKEDSE